MKIKIYVTGLSTGRTAQSRRGNWERYTSHGGMTVDGLSKDFTSYNQDCKDAIEITCEFANSHGFEYKVYDTAQDWPAFKAKCDGVKEIPTVIIGKMKIEGVPTKDELEHLGAKTNE